MNSSELEKRQQLAIDSLADTAIVGLDASIDDVRRRLSEVGLLSFPEVQHAVEVRLGERTEGARTGCEFLKSVLDDVTRSQSLAREVMQRFCRCDGDAEFTFGDRGIIIRRLDKQEESAESEGKFGDVYLVYFLDGSGPAVVKVSKFPRHTPGQQVTDDVRRNVDRFEREIALTQRLGERGVVPRCLGHGVRHVAGREYPYYKMEYLEGSALHKLMHPQRPLPTGFVIDSLAVWVRMLGEFQKLGIVHRDLKPANLFLCDDGSWRVLDLGLGRARDLPSVTTSRDGSLGNFRYMAPEQMHSPLQAGTPADLYAMAGIAYHAVTGRPAVPGDAVLEIQHWHATGNEPDITPVVEKHVALAKVLQQMLRNDQLARGALDEWIPRLYAMSAFRGRYRDFEAYLKDPVSALTVQMPPLEGATQTDDIVVGSRFDPQTLSTSLRSIYPEVGGQRRYSRRKVLFGAGAVLIGGGAAATYALFSGSRQSREGQESPAGELLPSRAMDAVREPPPSITVDMEGGALKRLVLFSDIAVEVPPEGLPRLYALDDARKEYICGVAFVCTSEMIARLLGVDEERLPRKYSGGLRGYCVFHPDGGGYTIIIIGLGLLHGHGSGEARLYSDDPQVLRARLGAGRGGTMSFYHDDAVNGKCPDTFPRIVRADPPLPYWPAPWHERDMVQGYNANTENLERKSEERRQVLSRGAAPQ